MRREHNICRDKVLIALVVQMRHERVLYSGLQEHAKLAREAHSSRPIRQDGAEALHRHLSRPEILVHDTHTTSRRRAQCVAVDALRRTTRCLVFHVSRIPGIACSSANRAGSGSACGIGLASTCMHWLECNESIRQYYHCTDQYRLLYAAGGVSLKCHMLWSLTWSLRRRAASRRSAPPLLNQRREVLHVLDGLLHGVDGLGRRPRAPSLLTREVLLALDEVVRHSLRWLLAQLDWDIRP